ncbi:MAG TPA: SigB/SigF/SigG family RNA polymerase sigma factor [Solirubrobacterales bacterium]|jgi:RNA polymerase sigma-B factor|nr:SigB/SigF/SigG family RNA polymerase sigma factor [Solirubrobacterales bacterium]
MNELASADIQLTPTPSPGPNEQLAGERRLLERYARDRSPTVREELVERFMPLARRLAARYAGGAEPFDDLVQVASVGLVKAIDRFDPVRGTAFSTFAVPTILGELKRHFRDRGWSVHVPRDVQERILKVERALADLPSKLGHSPTVQEIAERIEATDEEVLEAMHAAQGHHAVSLDASSSLGDGDDPGPLRDRIGEEDLAFDTVEYGEAIGPVLEQISERDRKVLHLRFVEDMTQSEIAEQVGVSQMHVSRILRATIEKLRKQIPEEE